MMSLIKISEISEKDLNLLKIKDLVEIKEANQFKKLLINDLYYYLRNHGIEEDEVFEIIMNLFLMKIYDELKHIDKPEEELDFQIKPEDYFNPDNFYKRMKKLLFEVYTELFYEDVEIARKKEILKHKEKEKILLEIVFHLQKFKFRSLRFLDEDIIGDIFLNFLHSIFRQNKGLFFTHPNICQFVCKSLGIEKVKDDLIEKQSCKFILDPSCGSGAFLISALRLLFLNCSEVDKRKFASKILYGIDSDPKNVILCKVNMFVHGDCFGNIYKGDALEPLIDLPFPFVKEENIERFDNGVTKESLKGGNGVDFIISNPPFSLKKKFKECEHFRMKDFIPFKNGVTNASECLFIERWFQLLKPKGRLGVVLPCALFDSKEYLEAKLLFSCYFKIVAIISLPEHVFFPYAQQKTVLVFAERRDIKESNELYNVLLKNGKEGLVKRIGTEKIICFNVENIGYRRLKRQRNIITEKVDKNDLTDDLAKIILDAFEGNFTESSKVIVKSLKDFWQNQNLHVSSFKKDRETITLKEMGWKIVAVEKIEYEELKDIDVENLFLCETGDIVSGGAGIITPKKLSATTSSNRERILKKIKSGKFGRLKEGDVIIAPVRVYQGKIAVVLGEASNFLFSKDFIVLRKEDITDPLESLFVFKVLTEKENLDRLMELSSTGKSGYPKIKDKEKILEIGFFKLEIEKKELKELKSLYETIYKKLF